MIKHLSILVKMDKHLWMLIFVLLFANPWPGFAGNDLHENKHLKDSLKIVRLTEKLAGHYRSRQFDSARIAIDSICHIAEQAGMRRKVADSYCNYSILARAKGDMDAFMENLNNSITIYKEEQVFDMAARAYTAIAQEYLNQKNYFSALENFSFSLGLRTILNDSLGMANNLINLGGVCYYTGRLTEASEYYYMALVIAKNLNNTSLTATVLKNLSNVHTQLRNFDIALEHLFQALDIQQESGNRKEESDVLLNLGITFYESGQIDKAENHLLASLAIKQELEKELHEMIKVYNNLGLVAKEKKDNDKAIEYYGIALELSRQTGDKQLEAVALNNIGSRIMEQNNPEAIPFLMESLEISTALGLKKLMLSSYKNLQEYYGYNQNYQLAYHYAQLFQEINDSVYNEESHARILDLQSDYELLMKEKENELLRQAAEIHEQEKQLSMKRENILRLRVFFLIILMIAIAILAISFIILYNLKQKTLKQGRELFSKESELAALKLENIEKQNNHLEDMLFAEEEIRKLQQSSIDQKNHELTASAILIASKNEVLEKLRKMAIRINETNMGSTTQNINEMIGEIDKQSDIEKQWEQFKKHFESIHRSFFSDLRGRYSDLTNSDLQLCAYIRLNLSTKEISRLMNITPGSVNTHRYRLRKKTGIEDSTSIDEFIHSIG